MRAPSSYKLPGYRNRTGSVALPKATTSSAFKMFMGRMSFARPLKYWFRDSGYMVRLYLARQMQEAQPYAFIKTYWLTMLLYHTWSLTKVVTML